MARRKRVRTPRVRYYQGQDWTKKRKSGIPKRIWLLLFLPAAWVITELCKHNAYIAEEVFAKRIYKVISVGYSTVTSWIPCSIAELVYIFVPLYVIFVVVRLIVRLIRNEDRSSTLLRFLLNVCCTVSVLLFTFVIGCGVNYYRYSFVRYSGLTVQDSTAQELYEMCLQLAKDANDMRSQAKAVDDQGVFALSASKRETAVKTRDAMQRLAQDYPILGGWNAVPKRVLLSKLMSYTEITGVFFPFTMEANVDVDIPDYSIPATMCHELSHLRGFMREDEANYLAYLACVNSGDTDLAYSGAMLALVHSGNALYRSDPELYRRLRSTYSDGVVKDLVANQEYWSRYEDTVVSKVSDKVNDTYLKANNQTDGVQSYGRMVDLLLALWRSSHKNY